MSIVVNGTTIPTKKGSIKVGSTNITKVVCNGTTVWEVVSDSIYIIKDGEIQSGYTNPSIVYYGHTARSGRILLATSDYVYGVYAHTNETTTNWYIATSAINTEGASTLEVTGAVYITGSNITKGLYVKLYNGSTLIKTESVSHTNYQDSFTLSFDISGYSSVSIKLETVSISSETDAWIGFGIDNLILK